MSSQEPLQVVDLFAGPGGLGEGFSSLDDGQSFKVIVSAEMDAAARETLRLRAFYRALRRENPEALDDYYKFCETEGATQPWTEKSLAQWKVADEEARQIRLGSKDGNDELDRILENDLDDSKPWVLIGGPPCQAYSVVGRARNRGNTEYKAEDDHRHFLYKEYLRIIQRKRPAIFVMENVKGILSSKVAGKYIFPQILKDLADPDAALGELPSGKPKYKICSLVSNETFESGDDPAKINASNFVIRAEKYGVPQGRHRVILVGVSEEYANGLNGLRLSPVKGPTVEAAIGSLPRLRSALTKMKDSQNIWHQEITRHLSDLYSCYLASGKKDLLLEKGLKIALDSFSCEELGRGGLRVKKNHVHRRRKQKKELDVWLEDERLKVWLNHEARGHMSSDLRRYIYASVFASVHKRSPKGHEEFDLPGLAPEHKNWKSGKFSDRFRVQSRKAVSSTITSHISKDGHYFIHYDFGQSRSLTVREAARLQTFPDNYFFQGTRTQQYHQVGNAVPPLLASKIAFIVKMIIGGRTIS